MSFNHPAKDQLIAFGQGKLAADESSQVEQHLEVCRECCETLLDLKDDTFVGLVKIAQSSDSNADRVARSEPQVNGVVAGSSASATSHALPDGQGVPPNVGMSKSAHSKDAATVLVQSGEPIGPDELPPELVDHPRYRVVELIGRGGMGNVYRAEHRLMNRAVAIKLINSQLMQHPHAVERFRREVQAAAKLSHSNIVAAYDAEQAGNAHFLVMEFVEGTDLASVVKQRGPMSVSEACECIRQAAAGLQHAYEKGMVHRDIKPHNLMLATGGQVRILDFGLAGFAEAAMESSPVAPRQESRTSNDADSHARHSFDEPDATRDRLTCRGAIGLQETVAHLTRMGSVMGTPDYMAPEQAVDAHSADIRADIYSLGCTLYFLLTGKPPFEADNVIGKLKAHASGTPPLLTALRNDVPAELSKTVARMLAKKPSERFQTPAEVVTALAPLTRPRLNRMQKTGLLIAAVCCSVAVLLGGLIVAITAKGRLEIQSEVEDVKVAVTKRGEQVEVFDLKTGSQMKWVPGGEYELEVVGNSNDVKLDKTGFTMSRFGKVVVTAKWNVAGSGVIKSFSTDDKPITQDGVIVDDGGWKITAKEARTVRLFEVPNPKFDIGPFFFRAKLRTENVTGRAYLEMWNRAPGQGEFFSKGFQNAVTGTTGWAEYEIPFFLKKGEQVDLVKFNVTIEGAGTVWIKDIELCGKQRPAGESDQDRLQGHWIAKTIKAGNGTMPAGAVPQWTMAFNGQSVQVTSPTGRNEGTFKLDVSKDPKEIDIETTDGKGLIRGIYRFVGEELEVCLEDSNRKRPIQWDVDVGTRQMLMRLQRSVTEARRESPVAEPTPAPFAAFRDLATVTAYLNHPQNNRGGSVPVALLGREGRVAFRFGNWLVVFEGIVCDPKATILGFSNFNIPHRGSSGEGTIDFGAGDKLPGVLIKFKFADEVNEIAINNFRFKLRGRATKLEFGDKTYDATNSLQTILVARDGSTTLAGATKDNPKVEIGVSQNLLTDPSFENTGLTQLPNGWRAWLNDGPEFRCEVVAGGHTGQRCLKISGKGTRGVVFANDITADRTKRYALKGWAKFEGDKDARAIIKLNYFRGSEFLGVHDLVGATADQPGWQLFEKTDALDAFPTANHFYAMCHVEGSGTGWFDDLELIAYDRDKLPADFDERHGRHNRLHGPNSLNRWVGLWETQYVFREFDNSPTETKLTMTTPAERTLGGYFLLTHDSAVPVAPKDRKPIPADPPVNVAAIGGDERLRVLTFDQNLGAFREWLFSSNGKSFEWRGPWNDAAKTLELRMLPDASNLFSAERFVDAEHIEGTLWQQFVMGRRDAGRWSATRKAPTAKVNLPAAKTHVADPAELSQLNKFAGEWTIHAKYKPSVWNPQPREETATEKSEWVLGGRFLMTRSFNEKNELTSIWIATYEPLEKSHHAWFFNGDGSSGQWRITWDEASREFHWRAIDMPTGWTGTALNRWIDDDTFDNQALIKDEQGRVLLDGMQERRRKK